MGYNSVSGILRTKYKLVKVLLKVLTSFPISSVRLNIDSKSSSVIIGLITW